MPNIVKNTSFPSLLDVLAPHSCRGCGRVGSVLCERCKINIISNHKRICPNCKQQILADFATKSPNHETKIPVPAPDHPAEVHLCHNCPHLPPIYTIASRDTILGELIHDYKYHSIRALARTFASLLDSTLPDTATLLSTSSSQTSHDATETDNSTSPIVPSHIVIIPLPTATHHIRIRGFDHIYLIAKHLARLRGYDTQSILLRNKNTVQVGTDRSTRLSQAKNAYIINPKTKLSPDALYILLDDVWTTGASMLAATDILRSTGIKNITCSLLAYST